MKQLPSPRGNPAEIRGLPPVRSQLKRLKNCPVAMRQSSKRSSPWRPARRCLPLLQRYVSISCCSLGDLLELFLESICEWTNRLDVQRIVREGQLGVPASLGEGTITLKAFANSSPGSLQPRDET